MIDVIAIVAAVTALCAVLLGPLVSLWSVNKQARIALRANNRQAWINTLRDTLAEFSSKARVGALAREYQDKYERSEALYFLEEKIKLLLNPAEDDHHRLIESVVEARNSAIALFADRTAGEPKEHLRAALDQATTLAQQILKREWERVKKAE